MIKNTPQRALVTLRRAMENTIVTHDGFEHAGYLSFLGLLSLFPFLVFLVSLAGFIGSGEIGREFIALMRDTLPTSAVEGLLPRIDEIIEGPSPGLLTLSMLAALWTSSSAVEGYRTILNKAYHVSTPPAYLWRRLLSIAQVLIFSVFIIAGMLIWLLLPLAINKLILYIPSGGDYIQTMLYTLLSYKLTLQCVTIGLLFAVIAMAYYVLPNIRQKLRMVLPGAAITLLGWGAALEGFRYYIAHFAQVNLIYGSLGSVIVALLFFYVLNIIFIFGAEVNYQLIRNANERVEEKEHAAGSVDIQRND